MEYLQITTTRTPINSRLERRQGRELAILLPGLNYPAEAPLFYYIGQLMHDCGVDTLSVDYSYNRDEAFKAETDENQLDWLKADGRAIMGFAINLGEYDRITIVGKSLGTILMGWAIPEKLPNARLVWLTPSLRGTGLQAQMIGRPNPSFCLIGTRDPSYTVALSDELTASGATCAVVEGADHGFSHLSGAAASAGLVQQGIEKLTDWMNATA